MKAVKSERNGGERNVYGNVADHLTHVITALQRNGHTTDSNSDLSQAMRDLERLRALFAGRAAIKAQEEANLAVIILADNPAHTASPDTLAGPYGAREVTIGRDGSNDISLPNTATMGVDRTHARLQKTLKGGWSIVDVGATHAHTVADAKRNGSVNGTFVNGRRIVPLQPFPLESGDEVRLGGFTFWVKVGTVSALNPAKARGEVKPAAQTATQTVAAPLQTAREATQEVKPAAQTAPEGKEGKGESKARKGNDKITAGERAALRDETQGEVKASKAQTGGSGLSDWHTEPGKARGRVNGVRCRWAYKSKSEGWLCYVRCAEDYTGGTYVGSDLEWKEAYARVWHSLSLPREAQTSEVKEGKAQGTQTSESKGGEVKAQGKADDMEALRAEAKRVGVVSPHLYKIADSLRLAIARVKGGKGTTAPESEGKARGSGEGTGEVKGETRKPARSAPEGKEGKPGESKGARVVFNPTPLQSAILLALLGSDEPMSRNELKRATGVSKGYSKALGQHTKASSAEALRSGLVGIGLVNLIAADKSADERGMRYSLTGQGRAIARQIEARRGR